MDIGRAVEVENLGLGRYRVGNHQCAALAGQQMGGAPVDLDYLAFGAIDGNPVIQAIRFRRVEHDTGEHVAQGVLQRKTDDDGDHARGREQAFDRQLHDVGRRSDYCGEEYRCAQDILQQTAGMPAAGSQQQTQHHGEGSGTE
ncbi:hypothetical protein D3C78_1149820 [compost metagenome]